MCPVPFLQMLRKYKDYSAPIIELGAYVNDAWLSPSLAKVIRAEPASPVKLRWPS